MINRNRLVWDYSCYPYSSLDDPRIQQDLNAWETHARGVEFTATDAPAIIATLSRLDELYVRYDIPTSYLRLNITADAGLRTPPPLLDPATSAQSQLNQRFVAWSHSLGQDAVDILTSHKRAKNEIMAVRQHPVPTPTSLEIEQVIRDSILPERISAITQIRASRGLSHALTVGELREKQAQAKKATTRNLYEKSLMSALIEHAPAAAKSLNEVLRARLNIAHETGSDPLESELTKDGLSLATFNQLQTLLKANAIAISPNLATMRRALRRASGDPHLASLFEPSQDNLGQALQIISRALASASPLAEDTIEDLVARGRIQTISPDSYPFPICDYTSFGPFVSINWRQSLTRDPLLSLAHELGHAVHDAYRVSQPLRLRQSGLASSTLNETVARFAELLVARSFSVQSSKLARLYARTLSIYNTAFRMGEITFEQELQKKVSTGVHLTADEITKVYVQTRQDFGIKMPKDSHYPYAWVLNPQLISSPYHSYKYLMHHLMAEMLLDKYAAYTQNQKGHDFATYYERFLAICYPNTLVDAFKEINIDLNNPTTWNSLFSRIAQLCDEGYKISEE